LRTCYVNRYWCCLRLVALFYTYNQQIGLKFEEETSEMLHLEHGYVWCWNLDASGNRSETPGKFRNGKANWIGHILRRNCLLKQVIEGKIKARIEVTRRRGRRRKKLLNDLGDRRGYSHLKEEALERLSGGIVLEEAVDLSSDRLLMNEWRHTLV
jgi:hypothetical protein